MLEEIKKGPSPWVSLLLDHDLAHAVLRAMEGEARRLFDAEPLRVGFWNNVSEFISGFLERYHRRAEEEVVFPMLTALGDRNCRETVEHLTRHHGRAHEITTTLCEGVRDCDWETVLRCAMIYVSGMRKHMGQEEAAFTELGHQPIASPALEEMRRKIDTLARETLGDDGRATFTALARSLCEVAGVEGPAQLRRAAS